MYVDVHISNKICLFFLNPHTHCQMRISIHLASVRVIFAFLGRMMEALVVTFSFHGFVSLEHLNLYFM